MQLLTIFIEYADALVYKSSICFVLCSNAEHVCLLDQTPANRMIDVMVVVVVSIALSSVVVDD